jgi:hypothetical protein
MYVSLGVILALKHSVRLQLKLQLRFGIFLILFYDKTVLLSVSNIYVKVLEILFPSVPALVCYVKR